MSLLQSRINTQQNEKKKIAQEISTQTVEVKEQDKDIINEINSVISSKFQNDIIKEGLNQNLYENISNTVEAELSNNTNLDFAEKERIKKVALTNIIGLGPIQSYMDDDEVTEIIVQKYNNICIEKKGIIYPIKDSFTDEQHLVNIINRIIQNVGRSLNLCTPMVDARLPDGSRINATLPPVTPDGATLTIRKFSKTAFTGQDYLNFNSLNKKMLEFLMKCVECKCNVLVSGGTGSGKTTLLNMLSLGIPRNELIVTIEDSCELKLNQPNVRRMEARTNISGETSLMPITIQTMVKNALRMRPDRIIVGEIRDGTVVDMMSAMSTGHDGSMSTVHANSPYNLIYSRLPILYSMYPDFNFSKEAQMMQISESLQLIIQISRQPDGSRKITNITHLDGFTKDGNIKLCDIFVYKKDIGFTTTGYVPKSIIQKMKNFGINYDISNLKKEGD